MLTTLLIDTNAQTSVFNESGLRKIVLKYRLKPTLTRLKDFGNGQIPICITINLQVTYRAERIPTFPFNVSFNVVNRFSVKIDLTPFASKSSTTIPMSFARWGRRQKFNHNRDTLYYASSRV